MKTKYNPGDYIFVPMKVSRVEIWPKGVYYRIAGGNDINGLDVLISEDKIIYGLHVKNKEVKHVSSNQNE